MAWFASNWTGSYWDAGNWTAQPAAIPGRWFGTNWSKANWDQANWIAGDGSATGGTSAVVSTAAGRPPSTKRRQPRKYRYHGRPVVVRVRLESSHRLIQPLNRARAEEDAWLIYHESDDIDLLMEMLG